MRDYKYGWEVESEGGMGSRIKRVLVGRQKTKVSQWSRLEGKSSQGSKRGEIGTRAYGLELGRGQRSGSCGQRKTCAKRKSKKGGSREARWVMSETGKKLRRHIKRSLEQINLLCRQNCDWGEKGGAPRKVPKYRK